MRRQCNKKAFVRDAAEIRRQGSAEKAVSVLECVGARWREVEPAAVRALLRGLAGHTGLLRPGGADVALGEDDREARTLPQGAAAQDPAPGGLR